MARNQALPEWRFCFKLRTLGALGGTAAPVSEELLSNESSGDSDTKLGVLSV